MDSSLTLAYPCFQVRVRIVVTHQLLHGSYIKKKVENYYLKNIGEQIEKETLITLIYEYLRYISLEHMLTFERNVLSFGIMKVSIYLLYARTNIKWYIIKRVIIAGKS